MTWSKGGKRKMGGGGLGANKLTGDPWREHAKTKSEVGGAGGLSLKKSERKSSGERENKGGDWCSRKRGGKNLSWKLRQSNLAREFPARTWLGRKVGEIWGKRLKQKKKGKEGGKESTSTKRKKGGTSE